jgi:hypothetical protein
MIKTLNASGIEGKYYNIIKTMYQEPTAMNYSSFMLKRFKRTFPQIRSSMANDNTKIINIISPSKMQF